MTEENSSIMVPVSLSDEEQEVNTDETNIEPVDHEATILTTDAKKTEGDFERNLCCTHDCGNVLLTLWPFYPCLKITKYRGRFHFRKFCEEAINL